MNDSSTTTPVPAAPTPSAANASTTVLVVDDERENLEALERIFAREGFRVLTAESGRRALDVCRAQRVHVVVTDLMMPGMSGIDLLKALETVAPDAEVVLMTAYGTIETAVEAMRAGAYDFVEKPLKRMQMVKTVQKAAERHALVAENRTLKQELSALKSGSGGVRPIIGSSPALRRALDIAYQAAPSTANVLVLGESGTGKELLARAIHERSGRGGAFVAVNLAALPETIVEGELFGYEKGAFTGAVQKREGRVAQAEGGTLFLDEIGELSPQVQVKLLRLLQEGEYEPLGGRTRRADFRLIAATNKDLRQLITEQRFREDLYYRLNVIAITSPPLRDRQGDVPLLVDHFLEVYCRKNGKPRMELAREALEKLQDYSWPGNVRELENVIERAVVLSRGATLTLADLPSQITQAERRGSDLSFSMGTPLEEIERRVIRATLDHTRGDKQLAAQLLGISARTIYRKLADLNEPDAAE
ncbi:sigma-54-dependent transcriptional regulator [Sandaracinus amylolyticus]|uniref:Response regulator of zinc sigma-54-dependent two-component system n=1 Tax=Sandaracinus amylolyticus TaxID=927083 RepID=A0A0F6YHD6_9BACT|nr:sigma-54 dependent transcriptional regulator [Sandaracinus amylolyticus]AKF03910.1 Response regulator of zinc sigma-54-dependent two-component system [Sandaracinus amylolyticus]